MEDRDGNIWYTGNAANLMGKLNPKTGQVTEYPIADPTVKDPHSLLIDRQGMVWFTAQNGNRVGRINPSTGEIKLLSPSTANSRPYGIMEDSKGMIYYVAFGTNKIGRVNPKTLEIQEYTLPNAASRPRQLVITPDDTLWYADFPRGVIGHLDPQTGQVDEVPSPSGPRSQPYGMSVINGIIWYSESGTRPGTVVRLDPKTKTTAIGLQAVTQVIPTIDGVHRLVLDDFFQQLGTGIPGDLMQLQKPRVEPRGEQMVQIGIQCAHVGVVAHLGQQLGAQPHQSARRVRGAIDAPQQLLPRGFHHPKQVHQVDPVGLVGIGGGSLLNHHWVGVEPSRKELEKLGPLRRVQLLVALDDESGHALGVRFASLAEQPPTILLDRFQHTGLQKTLQHGGDTLVMAGPKTGSRIILNHRGPAMQPFLMDWRLYETVSLHRCRPHRLGCDPPRPR
ncbi:MAG: hypothetical protein QM527_03010 [Alphaproteobacteria bacterium]|nr:hypothetical protein [Alphaproteobacteria bacterium]